MDLLDQIHGREPRRYLQFVCTLEVEVVDREQAGAYLLDSDDGGVTRYPNANYVTVQAVGAAVARGLAQEAPRAGFKVLGRMVMERPRSQDGRYLEVTLGPAPSRGDDGSYD